MNAWLIILAFFTLLLMTGCSVAPAVKSERTGFIQDGAKPLLVVIRDPRGEQKLQGIPGPGYQPRLAYHEDPAPQRLTRQLAEQYDLNVYKQWPVKSLRAHCFLIESPDDDVIEALNNNEHVLWVQPFNEYEVQNRLTEIQDTAAGTEKNKSVRDFFRHHPHRGNGIRIAVIDTGMDIRHPELDNTDLHYYDFVSHRTPFNTEKEKHGIAVTGLMASGDSNSKSIMTGLIHQADFYHLRGCWQADNGSGRCNTLTLALALDKTTELNPNILNLSLTGPHDRILSELINILLKQGTLVLSAYDDSRLANQRFPQPRQGVLYVSGSDHQRGLSGDISHTLIAPEHALTLAPGNQYDLVSGHSIATPHISAVAARLMNEFPHEDRNALIQRLQQWSNTYYPHNIGSQE